jgi:4-diphosphocytidyl-2C-methyl-D-erythritol kinase
MLRNNLEDVVVAKKPVIGRIIERLAHTLDKKAIVSGSGPSVFCLYRTRKEAMEARKMLLGGMTAGEKKRWQIFIAETTQI